MHDSSPEELIAPTVEAILRDGQLDRHTLAVDVRLARGRDGILRRQRLLHVLADRADRARHARQLQ